MEATTPVAAAPAAAADAVTTTTAAPPSGRRPTRDRKQVNRLTVEEIKKPTKLEIKSGKGVKLGDIPNVTFRVGKINRKDDFLKTVHRLMYKKPGTYLVVKKNILEFSGFTDTSPPSLTKVSDKLSTLKVEELNLLLETFDLPRGKGEDALKEGKVKRIVAFLVEPKVMSERDLQDVETKKRMKRKRSAERRKKKKTKGKKEEDGAKKKKRVAKKSKPTSLADDDDDDDDDGSGSDDDSSSSEPFYMSESDSDSDSEDDAPLVPKAKKEESFEEKLQKSVAAILKTADLSTFSLKDMLKILSAEFDGKDMKPHKVFIKEQVHIGLQKLS
jgi:protein DEK